MSNVEASQKAEQAAATSASKFKQDLDLKDFRARVTNERAEQAAKVSDAAKNVAFANPGATTELERVRGQFKKVAEAAALVGQGQGDLAIKKYGTAAVEAIPRLGELSTRLDSLVVAGRAARTETDRTAGALKERMGTVYEQAKFQATTSGKFTGQGVKVEGARALVRDFGEDQTKAFLGKNKFLLDQIPHIDAFGKKAAESADHTLRLKDAMQDAHSAARGLAGSMGQMWLTWGNTVPLVAAAALGGAMKAVVSNGKDVEFQLSFVSALTGEAAVSIDKFNGALAGSMIAPTQAAEALRGLAQNGLNTREAMAALPTVLSLATAGELTLSEAALGATGVLAAFNLGIGDMGRVSDVFTKAAAMSNTSVGGMVEAMKQASTVSDQFGVSLEQTAATLAVMAKRNIEGSAAGTAFRNMMKELATPTKGSREAMERLGLQVFDSQGKLKDFTAILEEVKAKTQDLNEQSRLAFIDKIFGERGGKAANALLSDLGQYKATLKELQEESKGFTKSVEDMLKATTEGRMRTLGADFKASTAEAFGQAKTSVDIFILSLDNAIASDKFKKVVGEVTNDAAHLAVTLLDHAGTISGLAITWGVWRASVAAWSVVSAEAGLVARSLAVANTFLATGSFTAATGTTALAAATNLLKVSLGPIITALSALAAAYYLLADHTSEAEKKQREMHEANTAAQRTLAQQIANLDERNAYLERYNKLLREGKSAEEAAKGAGGTPERLTTVTRVESQRSRVAELTSQANVFQNTQVGATALTMAQIATMRVVSESAKAALPGALAALKESEVTLAQADAAQAKTEKSASLTDVKKSREDLDAFNTKAKERAASLGKPEALKLVLPVELADQIPAAQVAAIIKAQQDRLNALGRSLELPDRKKDRDAELHKQAEEIRRNLREQLDTRKKLLKDGQDAEEKDAKTSLDRIKGMRLAGLMSEEEAITEEGRIKRGMLQDKGGTLQKASYMTRTTLGQNLGPDADAIHAMFNPKSLASGEYEEGAQGGASPFKVAVEKALKQSGSKLDFKTVVNLEHELLKETQGAAEAFQAAAVSQIETQGELKKLADRDVKALHSSMAEANDLLAKLEEQATASDMGATLTPMEAIKKEAAKGVAEVQHNVDKAKAIYAQKRDIAAANADSESGMAERLYTKSAKLTDQADNLPDNQIERATQLRAEAKAAYDEAETVLARAHANRTIAEELDTKVADVEGAGARAKKGAGHRPVQWTIDELMKPHNQPTTGIHDDQTKAMMAMVDIYDKLIDREARFAAVKAESAGKTELLAAIEQRQAQDRMRAGVMAVSSVKGFVDAKSGAYKTIERIEKAYHAYEMAMMLTKAAATLGLITQETAAVITGEAIKTGATGSGEAVRNLMKIPGVFLSFMSQLGPWGWAAAAAAVGALGLATGSFNSEKGGASVTNEGTGTVLGDPAAKSESIAKSLDMLKSVDTMTMQYSARMLSSLQSIDAKIKGVTNVLLRDGAITTGAGLGVSEFARKNVADPILNMIGVNSTNGIGDGLINAIGLGGVLDTVQGWWGGSNQEIGKAGVSINGNLGDVVQGRGMNRFADVTTTDKSWFGLDKQVSTSAITSALDPKFAQQFGLILSNFSDAIKAAAGPLDVALSKVQNSLSSYVVSIGNIDLKGLTGTALQEKLSAVFGAEGDKMAAMALPGLEAFTRVGEGYLETIVRVASGTESARFALKRLGVQMIDLNSIVNKQGDVDTEITRQSLVQKESKTASLTSADYSQLFKPGQTVVETTAAMAELFAKLAPTVSGIGKLIQTMGGSATDIATAYSSLVKVRDTFRSIGISGDAVTGKLVEGAGSLDALTSAMSSFEDKYLTSAEKLKVQSDRMTTSFGRLGLAVPKSNADFVKLVKGIDTSTEAGQELLGNVLSLSDAFYTMDQAVQDLGKTLQDEIDRIKGAMVPTGEQGVAQIQAQFATKTAAARAGDQTALDALPQLSQDLLKVAENFYNSVDLKRLQAATVVSLEETLRIVRQVAAPTATATPAAITPPAGTPGALPVADPTAGFQMGPYVSPFAKFATGGDHDGGWRMAGEAGVEIEALGRARTLSPTKTADALAAQGGWRLIGRRGAEVDSTPASRIFNADQTRRILGDVKRHGGATAIRTLERTGQLPLPHFATGGYHFGGARVVGEHGPELEVTPPAHIFNAGQTADILGGFNHDNDDQKDDLLRALIDEVRQLRKEVAALTGHAGRTAVNTDRTARVIERVTPGGDSIQVSVSA
jgi:TP901 family phage tail tape measure protein